MTTNEFKLLVSVPEDYETLSKEEQKKLEVEMVKTISRKECSDKNIDVSLIAYNELSSLGFKKDIPTYFLSKIIENLYHERKEFDSSDYFDLTIEENEHYKELVDYYNIGNEQFYRAMIAVAIGSSDCENKNVNEVVYGVVSNISKNINNLTRKYA